MSHGWSYGKDQKSTTQQLANCQWPNNLELPGTSNAEALVSAIEEAEDAKVEGRRRRSF